MLRNLKNIIGNSVHAIDGDIGTVQGFYFDDAQWMIRYLVVRTGSWLNRRDVLISPASFQKPEDPAGRHFPVKLDRQQIKDSPEIDITSPVTRQMEVSIARYYGWPHYWYAGTIPGEQRAGVAVAEQEKQKLFSSAEVFSYALHATDGQIGAIEDFIIDDSTWDIRYAIVDTRRHLPGKKVLLSTQWIDNINEKVEAVNVALSRETIQNSPPYHPDLPIDRTYENSLYEYYNKPKYWEKNR